MKIRAFIAIPVSDEAAAAFNNVQAELMESAADVKWEKPDKFHVTVKFLGDIDESILAELGRELNDSLGKRPAFDLNYATVGAFPERGVPRVVWIGAESTETILRIQEDVERVAAAHGIPRESRPFQVHITLGRVKGTRNVDRLTARLKSVTFKPLIVRCTHVHIIRSELKPSGSVYTLLKSIPLAL